MIPLLQMSHQEIHRQLPLLKDVYMYIHNIIAGVVLLTFGRKLFWLFLGVAGFLFGMEIAPALFGHQAQWVQLVIASITGCLGALAAIFLQRLAFTLGGFFAGVYLTLRIIQPFITADNTTMIFIVIGAGLLCAVIATLIMDQAITLLVCLVGAGAIVGELNSGHSMAAFIFVILTGAGYLFQEKLLPWRKKADRRR